MVGDAEGRPTDHRCAHLDEIDEIDPSTRDGCEDSRGHLFPELSDAQLARLRRWAVG